MHSEELTLTMDAAVIRRARKYASAHNTDLSKLVENYLTNLDSEDVSEIPLSPQVQKILSGKSIPGNLSDEELKEMYYDYQEKKHG
ncbi:hypothetical protein SAMN05443429_10567 [Cruoricaptor ignavus]|uniref:Antitoxin n=1 Tax=Cruoricaptor ignavus TaxID=1118202 RepID=A0A1M6EDF7_9FLAO|nr:DUF6364 family protein [Cruoricaptor ignavus]SHI83350.1 hypothetical protein SAMN05443429_10567 [Cruoricaptor ignavus]